MRVAVLKLWGNTGQAKLNCAVHARGKKSPRRAGEVLCWEHLKQAIFMLVGLLGFNL